jgi:hypothetical protein
MLVMMLPRSRLWGACGASRDQSGRLLAHDDDKNKPDFSGSYSLTGSKAALKLKKGALSTLRVVQNQSAVEITKVMDGHQNVNKFRLDGTEDLYKSPGGPKGTCKAKFKGKALILETLITVRPEPNGPVVQIHTREKWNPSSDSKTLTIRSEVDSPNSPLSGFQIIEPWSEIYIRN